MTTPPSSAPPRRRFSWKVRVIALMIGFATGLVVAEIGLRVAGVDCAAPYVPDEHCGSRLQPGHRFRQFTEGNAFIVVNSAGHRDREHARQKPPGVFRIAVLGDSFAEALQVDLQQTFWSVLERELQTCDALAGRTVEVLNFGVSGYGTTQELQMLRNYVWDYAPDVVLLAFLPGNDVRNNSRTLETGDPGRPFYELVDGQLRLDLSFRDEFRRQSNWLKFKIWCVRNVRLLGVLYRVKENWKARRVAPPINGAASGGEAGLDQTVYAPPHDAVWTEAWAITDAVLAEIQREVESHGAKLVVALLNNSIQLHSDDEAAVHLRTGLGVDDLDYPDRHVQTVGARCGFPVIVLTPRMRELTAREGRVFHGFPNTGPRQGHWNAEGHRVAGELLAKDLCELLQ